MSALQLTPQAASLAERLADLAVDALIAEADLSPKPALVDRRGSGAHTDLHLGLMHSSALSLWPTFKLMADAAGQFNTVGQPLREALGRLGREGEATMLRTTLGVNTHRGAIWALGLLVTAAALDARNCAPEAVFARAASLAQIKDREVLVQGSHGNEVVRRYGVMGAREQAQQGFPAVRDFALPQLQRSRAGGSGEQNARLDALLAIMTTLSDTCVLHRAGIEGLHTMQRGAQHVLDVGGSASLAGRRALNQLDQQLLALNASPGGAADLLAACLFIDGLEPALGRVSRSV
ncbi:triphosphoribosyl-dephospho-CoA synthase [Pseudomonas amygdali]|uniref:triphosphoribosyl-dephospho-CoA synthase n=1 Tax=Pseudomonas amygdali TaxID=47877 RepID=UPI000CD22FD4|nr:triphosphoribosyl-dephospho-CoA synthase [Pseudomonas amygdali]POD02573.1 triphosphoribosyl-dephospho-CoA synthase MdcB [Pseudomonas amygdali pv. morsprunorum]POD47438.1 triphosphoribosyl-dephospho-CoA synthase MdcB [Pseudomonas amygdali pv. morsprunorum]POD52462.1 triphosphoribosyl-dephospho-CoA synthase MdcB [Pseudomonas amygdali pv. morsprunorum]